MRKSFAFWIENYLFYPNFLQTILAYFLSPLSFIYLNICKIKKFYSKPINFNIPIISIGNLVVGGSGKTPLTIELAKRYEKVFIVLRGYKRDSKGLQIVSLDGEIKTDINNSGDEAMLLAKSLKKASVIVSENRVEAIKRAKTLGAKVIFLDDGFSKYNIKKFDILLSSKKEPKHNFCLPSGAYRMPKSFYKYANLILKEDDDFKRIVSLRHLEKNDLKKEININELNKDFTKKNLLLSAISKPKRLLEFFPKNMGLECEFFPDHHDFTKKELNDILLKYENFNIFCTQKDLVKLEKHIFFFNKKNIYSMDLELKLIKNDFLQKEPFISLS